jgi:hypothetical protein
MAAMRAKTEELLYMLLWASEMLWHPTFRNFTESFEDWAYRNGLAAGTAARTPRVAGGAGRQTDAGVQAWFVVSKLSLGGSSIRALFATFNDS